MSGCGFVVPCCRLSAPAKRPVSPDLRSEPLKDEKHNSTKMKAHCDFRFWVQSRRGTICRWSRVGRKRPFSTGPGHELSRRNIEFRTARGSC